jgi:hypothetical protein
VILLALAALVFLILADSPRTSIQLHVLQKIDRDLLKFGLAALLLGAGMAGISLIPLFEKQEYRLPLYFLRDLGINATGSVTHNYELGALAVIIVLGAAAVIRRAPLLYVSTFGIASIAGNSMVLGFVDPNEVVFGTLIGWSLCYLIVIFVAVIMPDILRLFGSFWRVGRAYGDPPSTWSATPDPQREPEDAEPKP